MKQDGLVNSDGFISQLQGAVGGRAACLHRVKSTSFEPSQLRKNTVKSRCFVCHNRGISTRVKFRHATGSTRGNSDKTGLAGPGRGAFLEFRGAAPWAEQIMPFVSSEWDFIRQTCHTDPDLIAHYVFPSMLAFFTAREHFVTQNHLALVALIVAASASGKSNGGLSLRGEVQRRCRGTGQVETRDENLWHHPPLGLRIFAICIAAIKSTMHSPSGNLTS